MNNDIYREELLDHYHNPRNFGKPFNEVEGIPQHMQTASKNNPLCGDTLCAYAELSGEFVKSVHFDGSGCAISIASASMLSEFAQGKKKTTLLKMTPEELVSIIHINPTPTRLKCALLSLEVLQKALTESKK